MSDYPAARLYLMKELWPNRTKWASAYAGGLMTLDVNTTQAAESYNSKIKKVVDSKTSLAEMIKKLEH